MIDFHNHLLPAVDDGAANLDETRASLAAMREVGVSAVIMTPHLRASVTERPAELATALSSFDAALSAVRELAGVEFPDLQLHRGVELMLDSPTADLTDPRLRLAGTSFVLVEFPSMMVPPHSVQALYELKLKGWRPIVAHPERYRDFDDEEVVEDWRTVGALLQVNAGSFVGRYGEEARKLAWSLVERGVVDFVCSDYHARGRLRLDEMRQALLKAGGEEQLRLLTVDNPARMLADQDPLPVPRFKPRQSLWNRLRHPLR